MSHPSIDPDLIRGELSRRSLKHFIAHFWNVLETVPFCDGWVIDAYVDHLAHISEIHNLLVAVPPGASKSLVFNVFYFCWRWLQDPSTRYLYASYALKLSQRDNNKCRRLLTSDLFKKCFPHAFVITQDNENHIENNKTGVREATAVGSITTGLKANYAIVDDPLNAQDAESIPKKHQCHTWFRDGFFNRLNDFGRDCRIVIGQRLATDDLHGYIKETYPGIFTELTIPYEYRKSAYVSVSGWADPRQDGEPLWVERYPPEFIRAEKLNCRKFSAQYNQEPIDLANALFKPESFRYWDEAPDSYILGDRRVLKSDTYYMVGVDLASTVNTTSDYSVIAVCAIDRLGNIIVIHLTRERIPLTKLVPRLTEVNALYRPAYFLVEEIHFQKLIMDQCRHAGLPVRGYKPQGQGDKEERSIPLQIKFESAGVWFRRNAPWVPLLESELVSFPGGRFDDQVDSLSMVAIALSKLHRQPVKKTTGETPQQTEAETYQAKMLAGIPCIAAK